ncbi:4'-phosphopantetheinyl transferase family protein [Desulfotalea psychrophila]|uniref:4'-phosphopantetheinyl transferase domain-containing protein n=1 Tax=Desulfotalea psychrophila (strain LSv54 / DSM 12343) TaxID=177439 RepID=Q6APT1_DESPS|nr:4'-phosphopantetheinyl transferase family protein [Desulfotalea psychrophila]CAG35643.1 hypothetical protein DP0914 [Desulfotalea psychrophila LSv54]
MDKNIFSRQLSNFIQDKMAPSPTGFITELFPAEKICLAVLTKKEQKQLEGYKLNKRRCEWFSGRFAGKKAIQEYLHNKDNILISLAEIEILNREDGRPYFNSPGHLSLDISISHSRDYAISLVAERPCGIDIQRAEKTLLRVAERFCSRGEMELLQQGEDPFIIQLTKLWAAKEALQKAVTATGPMPGFLEIRLQSIERENEGEVFQLHCKEIEEATVYSAGIQLVDNYALAFCLLNSKQSGGALCQSYQK